LDRFDVLHCVGRQRERGRPNEVSGVHAQKQKLLFGFPWPEVVGFDFLAFLEQGLSSKHRFDDEYRVAIDIHPTVADQTSDRHGVHGHALLAQRLGRRRAERTVALAATLLHNACQQQHAASEQNP